MSRHHIVALVLYVSLPLSLACSDGEPPSPAAPEPLPAAAFSLTARILGPVSQDDDSDMEFTLQETKGISASLNFARMTCSNGAKQEWGAAGFADRRVTGGTTFMFTRHYRCPNSGRPREVVVDLTDDNGYHHIINAAPYHPDWPGA